MLTFVGLRVVGEDRRQAPSAEQGQVKPVQEQVPRTFDAPAVALRETVVVPTLDSPMPKGRNIVWCCTFQMAWEALGRDVLGAPPMVRGAEDASTRMNVARTPDLPPGTGWAKAGRATPAFFEKAREDFQRRFPGTRYPDFPATESGLAALAHVATKAAFSLAFLPCDKPLQFRDPSGRTTPVAAFGIGEQGEQRQGLRKQVAVLWLAAPEEDAETETTGIGTAVDAAAKDEFVIDLDRGSSEVEVLLARVGRRATLGETWACVAERTAKPTTFKGNIRRRGLLPDDTLAVPSLDFRLVHHFTEFEGQNKTLANPGFEGNWFETAVQSIEFRLDERGVVLSSDFLGRVAARGSIDFVFDRPFLVTLRARDRRDPFFVAWVETAELMVPSPTHEGARPEARR